jgi:hypothetical protein
VGTVLINSGNRYREPMKHKIAFMIIFISLLFSSVNAQIDSANNFVPDRPGMATPPNILTYRSFQIEDGMQFEKYAKGSIDYENYLFSSLLLRYGIHKNIELRIQTDYAYSKVKEINASTIYGLNPITIGSKIKFINQRKLLPNISILVNVTLPYFGKKEFRPNNLAPSLTLLMSNTISEKINVSYNYGISWDDNTSVPTHFSALSLAVNLSSKWSTFIEGYGFANQMSKPVYYIDTGVAYLINGYLQIDLSATGNLNPSTHYYSVNAGIAWKI